MRRWTVGLPLLVMTVVACTTSSEGGLHAPVSSALAARSVVTQVELRDAALRFVRAYAAAPNDDAEALGALAGTPLLRSWVHWFAVQNHEFPGTMSGTAEVGGIGTAVPVELPDLPGSGDILQDVPVAATIRFSATPETGSAFAFSRVLDGPVRMLLDRRGVWKVADFVRDGTPLSAVFQPIEGAHVDGRGLSVTLDSFVASPAWQFNLVVTPHVDTVSLRTSDATLVDATGSVVAVADNVSMSLVGVSRRSTAEGIVGFPVQASAKGITLRLTFSGSDALEFPLGKLIEPLKGAATSSASPSVPVTAG